LKHFATPSYWYHYRQLPPEIRELADRSFALLKEDPRYPSLRFRKLQDSPLWSVRVGLHYRALAKARSEGYVWFWIGHHSEYDQLVAAL